MPLSEQWQARLILLLNNDLFQQIAPLFILIIIPTIVFFVSTSTPTRFLIRYLAMGLEGLGSILPWNWSSNSVSQAGSSSRTSHGQRKGKKAPRTRAEQMASGSGKCHQSFNGGPVMSVLFA
jgi:hypothetical protein